MTPGARIASAIEVLDKIESNCAPSEDIISSYVRGRRYIGSKDRKAIITLIFKVIRSKSRLDWLIGEPSSARLRVLASLFLIDQVSVAEINGFFSGIAYSPAKLSKDERKLLKILDLKEFMNEDYPLHVEVETPKWLTKILLNKWGENFKYEMSGLNERACIDLRVNTLKCNCTKAIEILKKDKIHANSTNLSPIGLRVMDRANLQSTTAYKAGFIEVQDEGSQIISALVDTKANIKTIDLCAGGGGKTLALAAIMKDGGPLIACDTDFKRLKNIKPRTKRAGVTNVTIHHLTNENDNFYHIHKNSAERVLADVPCSGSGSWRRAPMQKWKLSEERLNNFIEVQRRILLQASDLLVNGGRLIYSTCSVLPGENEYQIDWFIQERPNFKVLPIQSIWNKVFETDPPLNTVEASGYLSLTPKRHNTDGFFCAVLEKCNN